MSGVIGARRTGVWIVALGTQHLLELHVGVTLFGFVQLVADEIFFKAREVSKSALASIFSCAQPSTSRTNLEHKFRHSIGLCKIGLFI